MEKDLIQLLVNGSVTTIIGGIVILIGYWLCKFFLDRQLEIKKSELIKGVEDYKNALTSEHEQFMIGIERAKLQFQSEVDKKLAEHNVLFSSLNVERFRVTNKVFGHLVNLFGMAKAYTSVVKVVPFENSREDFEKKQIEDFKDEYASFWKLYSPNRLYYTESLSSKIFKIANEINRNVEEYAFKKVYDFDGFGEDKVEIIQENSKNITALEPNLKEIENELREILGVD